MGKRAPSKETDELMRYLEKHNFSYRRTGGGHFLVLTPNGDQLRHPLYETPIIVAGSPSARTSRKSRLNVERAVRAWQLDHPRGSPVERGEKAAAPRAEPRAPVVTPEPEPEPPLFDVGHLSLRYDRGALGGPPPLTHAPVVALPDSPWLCPDCAAENGYQPLQQSWRCPFHEPALEGDAEER